MLGFGERVAKRETFATTQSVTRYALSQGRRFEKGLRATALPVFDARQQS